MPSASLKRSDLHVIPMLANESLYVGIDVGKLHHVAGFVSPTLLKRHERYEVCPVLRFDNSREGVRLLVERIREYVPLEQCFLLYVRYNQNTRVVALSVCFCLLYAPVAVRISKCLTCAGNNTPWW